MGKDACDKHQHKEPTTITNDDTSTSSSVNEKNAKPKNYMNMTGDVFVANGDAKLK